MPNRRDRAAPATADNDARRKVMVRVDAVEYGTPNPGRWGFHKCGLDLEDMPVVVKLGCGHKFVFETGQHLTQWFGSVNHRYELQRDEFVVDCRQCARCEVGLRLRTEEAVRSSEVGIMRRDGTLFFPYTPGPIKTRKPGK
jgi:hypothetical protein